MENVSPLYYASGERTGDYILVGSNFDLIPDSAVGLLAINNDLPLEFIDKTTDNFLFSVFEKTENRIVLRPNVSVTHSSDSFIGAIVSNDRRTVYWVNDSKPLH